jgi:hypothetical protein
MPYTLTIPNVEWYCGQFTRPAGSSIPTLDVWIPNDYINCQNNISIKYCIYAGPGKRYLFADKMLCQRPHAKRVAGFIPLAGKIKGTHVPKSLCLQPGAMHPVYSQTIIGE